MDQLQLYESQVSDDNSSIAEAVIEVDGEPEVGAPPDSLEAAQILVVQAAQAAEGDGSSCDELEVGSQEYDGDGDVQLDEALFSVVSTASNTRPLILDIDNLPARTKKGGAFRKVPEGPAPKATRGWTLEELSGVIEHLGLEGAWKQGGKEARAVYEGPDPSRPQYIINYEKSACWVQGKQAQAIDIRIRAARRQ